MISNFKLTINQAKFPILITNVNVNLLDFNEVLKFILRYLVLSNLNNILLHLRTFNFIFHIHLIPNYFGEYIWTIRGVFLSSLAILRQGLRGLRFQ